MDFTKPHKFSDFCIVCENGTIVGFSKFMLNLHMPTFVSHYKISDSTNSVPVNVDARDLNKILNIIAGTAKSLPKDYNIAEIIGFAHEWQIEILAKPIFEHITTNLSSVNDALNMYCRYADYFESTNTTRGKFLTYITDIWRDSHDVGAISHKIFKVARFAPTPIRVLIWAQYNKDEIATMNLWDTWWREYARDNILIQIVLESNNTTWADMMIAKIIRERFTK